MTMNLAQQIGTTGIPETVRPSWGYYRQPNGWLTGSPATEIEELKYRREGWEPLLQYGRFMMDNDYMADHPFEPLFIRGGAHEFSLEQIVQSGFHLKPPVVPTCGRPLHQYHPIHRATCWVGAKPVVFPQLDGKQFEDFSCRFCGEAKATKQVRDQHEAVAHKKEQGEVRTGEALAAALLKGLQGVSVPPAQEEAKK